jgi:hypothetical protein
MPKPKSCSSKPSSVRSPASAFVRRLTFRALLGATFTGTVGYGFDVLRERVARQHAFPQSQLGIILKQRPTWMSDALAQQVANSIRPAGLPSAMDHQVLHDVADVCAANPWVKNVRQVRRVFNKAPGDAIEIDCDYRTPMALVHCGDQLVLIDEDGYKLPEKFPAVQPPRIMFDAQGHMNIRIIDGVHALPPYLDGQKWSGDDLHAGLQLAKLLHGKTFTEEVHRINVSNFGGRRNPRDPQITLVTKHKTEIRWGEPLDLGFHAEKTPGEKLQRLASLHQRYGRIDGGYSWLDIRLDKVLYPQGESPLVQGN